ARHIVACELARLRAAYAAGDLAALTRMLVIPGRSDELLDERNRRWLPQIERYLADRGAFIAVGLGHLLGDAGLLVTLERAGYTVERRADLQARAPGAAPRPASIPTLFPPEDTTSTLDPGDRAIAAPQFGHRSIALSALRNTPSEGRSRVVATDRPAPAAGCRCCGCR
ncbi:MAG TPA: TraB/GumN family protein, partial [Kofleriaceae bacterium]